MRHHVVVGGKKERRDATEQGLCSIAFIVKVVFLFVAFVCGILLGKSHSHDQQQQNSPIKCRSKLRSSPIINSEVEVEPCSASAAMCPSYYSPNKNLSVLVLGGATAPKDIFPFLHHPTSPVQWSFYLTTQPTVTDSGGQLIPNEILWGSPQKNKRKKKKNKKDEATELVTTPK